MYYLIELEYERLRMKYKLRLNNYALLIFVIGIILISVALYIFFPKNNTIDNNRTVNLSIMVTSDKDSIRNLAKSQKQVFLNSTNTPVTLVSVVDEDKFIITLSAPGKITDGAYYFNGQRVLVGQKAEIHSTYFAQGIITNVSYAN